MKKILSILLIGLIIIGLTGCGNKKDDDIKALEFKDEYESVNGKTNSSGKEYRILSINEDNPYVKTTSKEIITMIENKETFYLYVGDPLCPWCRSVLEKSIEVANKYNIDKIYYIDIWDDDGNEILRDKYEIVDNNLTKTIEGTEEYYKMLEVFDKVLKDYTITDSDGNTIETSEKRIYAPNFFYIKNGKVDKLITGISDKQKDSREKLTDEILEDEEEQFINLFSETCDDNY